MPGRIPELARFVPPARAFDKYVYSPRTSVIVVTDAVCSSADETCDATMALYTNRFGAPVETVTTDTLLESWQGQLRTARAS